jgi:hypothetical protein
MSAIVGVDQLRGDADAIAGAANTAFEDVLDPESLRDFSDVLLFVSSRSRPLSRTRSSTLR